MTHVCIYIYIGMHSIYIYIHICIHSVYMYMNIHLYRESICMYIYIYIIYTRICIYIYIFTDLGQSWHVCTLREYVCYVGRLKGSMHLVNMRLVVRNAAKT